MSLKKREYPESNYRAIFINGMTLRQKLDVSKPFIVPPTPEIEDVAINSKCFANCPYCYTSATKDGVNFTNVSDKAIAVWGSLPENERPFQIAIGGAGEATIHPEFPDFIKTVHELGILPNYTTNGMHLNDKVMKATEDYCGGVAVSFHPHIRDVFTKAVRKLAPLRDKGMKLNAHVIVGDMNSFYDLQMVYETFKDELDYIVVLPYQAAGRGVPVDVHETWKTMFEYIYTKNSSKFAFGALFYDWLMVNPISLKMSLYEPEMFSGYRMMDDSYKVLRKSSYNLAEKTINE